MKNLKTAISILATASVFASCDKMTKNIEAFTDNEWYLDSSLIIRNDSAFSYSKYDTVSGRYSNPQLIPLKLTDSTMIISRYKTTGEYDSNHTYHITGSVLETDTVLYDIKYINKRAKLILYADPFPIILQSKNKIHIEETDNFKSVKFALSDFSIGDQIDRSLLKTIGVYNYPNYTIEDCEFVNDKNLSFRIIGYNHIFSIERKKIEDYQIKEIINVVTDKLGNAPEYNPMRQWAKDSDYEQEFYRWTTNGVRIELSRSKYIGNDSYKTLINNRNWNLSYDDVVLQAILVETYKNSKPQSSIIN